MFSPVLELIVKPQAAAGSRIDWHRKPLAGAPSLVDCETTCKLGFNQGYAVCTVN